MSKSADLIKTQDFGGKFDITQDMLDTTEEFDPDAKFDKEVQTEQIYYKSLLQVGDFIRFSECST